MRLPARILLNAATVVSLVLCVALAVLWARSYRHTDEVFRELSAYVVTQDAFDKKVETSRWWVASSGGGVVIYRQYFAPAIFFDGPDESVTKSMWGYFVDGELGRGELEHAGLVLADGTHVVGLAWARASSPGRTSWIIRVPYWALLALAAGLPASRILTRARELRRLRRRVCVRCGYDLRATPARCPECNTAPPAPTS